MKAKEIMPPQYQRILPHHTNHDEKSRLIQSEKGGNKDYEQNDANLDGNNSLVGIMSKQLTRKPILTFTIMLLLACTLGHTLTVIYYWDSIYHPSYVMASSIDSIIDDVDSSDILTKSVDEIYSTREPKKVTKKKAQQHADEQVKLHLNDPSLESEKYYNYTLSLVLTESHNKKSKKSFSSSLSTSNPPPKPPPRGCEATIMIIRHCEKRGFREHCNSLGKEIEKLLHLSINNTIIIFPFSFHIRI